MSHSPVVLLIEDDTLLQELYSDRFREAGFTVLQAFDGIAAIELMEKHQDIQVILVDIMLPKLSGYDVIKQIRHNAMHRDIPILILSALTDEVDRKKGLDAGANEYVGKGELAPKDMVELVKRYVGPQFADQKDSE